MIPILNENYNGIIAEAKMVFGRRGTKVVRKYRCTVGKRAGRVVSDPKQCNAPIDLKKRFVLKRTKAQKGNRMAKRAQKTKRINPASRVIQKLNKRR